MKAQCKTVNGYKRGCCFFSWSADSVEFLLDHPGDDTNKTNITNSDGRTCLHIAALTNNIQLCELLIKRGADANALMQGKVG